MHELYACVQIGNEELSQLKESCSFFEAEVRANLLLIYLRLLARLVSIWCGLLPERLLAVFGSPCFVRCGLAIGDCADEAIIGSPWRAHS